MIHADFRLFNLILTVYYSRYVTDNAVLRAVFTEYQILYYNSKTTCNMKNFGVVSVLVMAGVAAIGLIIFASRY